MRIERMDASMVPKVKALVIEVFGAEGWWNSCLYAVESQPLPTLGRLWMRIFRLHERPEIWVALDDSTQEVIGTIGLYRIKKDHEEALWVWYFCVAAQARGAGAGSKLLDHVIGQAKMRDVRYLRLLTSNVPSEESAQRLYESRGLRIFKTKSALGYKVLFRELDLRTDSGPAVRLTPPADLG